MENCQRQSEVLIALGSNLGDREAYISQAVFLLNQHCGEVTSMASLLETEPMGAADQQFINSALICKTDLTPPIMLEKLQSIERQLGRTRNTHWGNRTIDLDILMWRNPSGEMLSFSSKALTIPHPEMLKRDFVMIPATEIASDWVHPAKGCSLSESLF